MTFDQSILRAYEQDLITEETARLFCFTKGQNYSRHRFNSKARGIDADVDSGLRLDLPEKRISLIYV